VAGTVCVEEIMGLEGNNGIGGFEWGKIMGLEGFSGGNQV